MSTSDTPKWKVVENVVAAIERSLNSVHGARVIPNTSIPERVSGVPRQVDVYLEIPTGPRILRVGVEVRDKSASVDLPEIEQLIAKLKKLDIDYGCVVSRAGFTATAKEEAQRNGIELRTIAEVENPDWWVVPAMILHLRQVELIQCQVNFQSDDLVIVTPMLAGVNATDLELTLANGKATTLSAFVEAQGLRALDRPELAHLTDRDTFTLVIDFGDLSGASFRCPRGLLPAPQSVYALYRLHDRLEMVRLAAYQGQEGVTAFTGISTNWQKQITLVAKPNPDGTRTISFTTEDPTPSKTVIGRRVEIAEQSHAPDAQKDAHG